MADATRWPPTLAEFMAYCKPGAEDYGAPSLEAAWNEARRNAFNCDSHAWSHRAVQLAGRSVGWLNLHETPDRDARDLKAAFAREYVDIAERLANGPEMIEDGKKNPALDAELNGLHKANEAAQDFAGISPAQALKLMRAPRTRKNRTDKG